MGKAFCERPFALHGQQPEKDKRNVDFPPPEKFLRTSMTDLAFRLIIGNTSSGTRCSNNRNVFLFFYANDECLHVNTTVVFNIVHEHL